MFRFDQIVMTDCAGEAHEFHFRTRLLGSMVAVDAFELKRGEPAGYQFQILGDPEDDLLSLLGRLVERMRRSLSVKHLVQSEHGLQIADQTVRGANRLGRIVGWAHASARDRWAGCFVGGVRAHAHDFRGMAVPDGDRRSERRGLRVRRNGRSRPREAVRDHWAADVAVSPYRQDWVTMAGILCAKRTGPANGAPTFASPEAPKRLARHVMIRKLPPKSDPRCSELGEVLTSSRGAELSMHADDGRRGGSETDMASAPQGPAQAPIPPSRGSTSPSSTTTRRSTGARRRKLTCRAISGFHRPSVHQMVLSLEKLGFVERTPGQGRSLRLLLRRDQLPDLM